MRQRSIGLVVAGALVVAVLAGIALARPAGAAAATPTMIVGDSISQGSAGDYTWRYRLWKHLQSRAPGRVDFVGDRTAMFDNVANTQGSSAYADANFDRDHHALWGRAAWQEKDTIRAAVARYRPKMLCLMLGINDIAWGGTPDGAFNDLKAVITNARAGRADVQIVIGQVLTRYDFFHQRYENVAEVNRVNQLIGTLPSAMGTSASPIRVAATADGWDPKAHTWDGTHPSATGEVRIAAAFADALAGLGIGSGYGSRPTVAWPFRPARLTTSSTAAVPGAMPRFPTALGLHLAAKLNWPAAPRASGYLVRQRIEGRPEQELPLAVPGTSFEPGLLQPDEKYDFRLVPVNDHGKNRLSWSAVPGATGYKIHRRDATARGPWEALPYPVQTTSFDDQVFHPEHTFEYAIQATKGVMDGGKSPVASQRTRQFGPPSTWSNTVLVKHNTDRRKRAADFARHWGHPDNAAAWNDRYRYFGDFGNPGNDCAHLVSQSLLQAGYPEVGDPGAIKFPGDFTDEKWWRTNDGDKLEAGATLPELRRNASFTFSLAKNLRNHIKWRSRTGATRQESDPRLLNYGDVVFFDDGRDGTFDHAVIITGFDAAGWPLYSQHTYSKSNASLHDALAGSDDAVEFWRLRQLTHY